MMPKHLTPRVQSGLPPSVSLHETSFEMQVFTVCQYKDIHNTHFFEAWCILTGVLVINTQPLLGRSLRNMPLGYHLLCVKTAMLFAGFKCTTACVRVLLSAVAVTSLALTPSDFVGSSEASKQPSTLSDFHIQDHDTDWWEKSR